MGFVLFLYHMGRFEKKRGVKYVGGEIHAVKCIDPDRWSYFEALGIVKEFKYGGEVRLWWKGSSESLYNNLRLLNDDREALNLAKYADDNEEEVELDMEHLPSMPEIIKCIEGVDGEAGQEHVVQPEVVEEVVVDKVVMGEEEEVREQEVMEEVREEEVEGEEVRGQELRGEEVREEEVRGQELRGEEVRGEEVRGEEVREEDGREEEVRDRLDESEEERVADDDDGFGMDNVPRRNFKQVLERWNRLKAKSNSGRKKRNVGEGSFVTNDCVGQHEINEEYDSEQLCSDVDSDEVLVIKCQNL